MDDLVATISNGMHVGQQANDLKELHAKLAQTLQQPTTRPGYAQIPSTSGPHSSGPMPPPAPASSWNEAPANVPVLSGWTSGLGNSPRQVTNHFASIGSAAGNATSAAPVAFVGQRETGFAAPERPHHNTVLPADASPHETVGFAQDAFRPLWEAEGKPAAWKGFAAASKS